MPVGGAECVGDPASERRMVELAAAMYAGGLDNGWEMVPLVTPHGAHDGELVDDLAHVGNPVGHRDARFSVVLERPQNRDNRTLHLGDVVAEPNRVDELA